MIYLCSFWSSRAGKFEASLRVSSSIQLYLMINYPFPQFMVSGVLIKGIKS